MSNESNSHPFLAADEEYCRYDNSQVVIFPCPYEKTTSYMTGTEKGPDAILEASEQVEFFDSELKSEPVKKGIFTFPTFKYDQGTESDWLGKTETAIYDEVKKGKFPVMLGGEHTISISPIRAVAKHHGADNLSILHFDAHSDMRDTYHGNPYSHASIMRRAHEVIPRSYSIGIRAQCQEEWEYIQKNPKTIGILYDHERAANGINVEKALQFLPTKKVYLTIDLDYFTPEEMPSVGTPVPGGGHWYETLFFLREIFKKREVVGFDIVELKPDHDVRSTFFTAQLVYKLIAYAMTASESKQP